MADRIFKPETLAIHAGQIPDVGHRRSCAADLPDHELRVRFGRARREPVQPADLRQRLLALEQPDGCGAGRTGGRARRRPRRGGVGQRHGGRSDGADDDAAGRRPRGRCRCPLRRHGDDAGGEPHQVRRRDVVRRRHQARGLCCRDTAQHSCGVRREPGQPEPGGARHRGRRRRGPCARCAAGDRQHRAEPVPLQSDSPGRRHRGALGHQVPRRPRHHAGRHRGRKRQISVGQRQVPRHDRAVAGLSRRQVLRDLRRLRLHDALPHGDACACTALHSRR